MEQPIPRKQLTTYLPVDLKGWLEVRSVRNHRSMNSELIAILSAIRDDEANGSGFERLANPSGVPGAIELFSPEENDFARV